MKLIWLTDIHLNFLSEIERMDFYKKIVNAHGDNILLSGDITEAPLLSTALREMATNIQKPIYFVLGNHDYYHGEVQSVREEMKLLTQTNPFLHWLPASDFHKLDENTLLFGVDAWADGRYGDYANSSISVNDSKLIVDLFRGKLLGKYPLLEQMQLLADNDAKRLKVALEKEIKANQPKKVIILTHVPPFQEVCLYEGNQASADYLPFFCSKVTGDAILEVAKQNKDIKFLVLCGHTHCKAHSQIWANLIVKVGTAEYNKPDIEEIFIL